jgi:hypothetical protein
MLTVVVIVSLYYLFPSDLHFGTPILLRFAVGVAVFIFVMVWQVRQILHSKHPGLRAGEALAIIAVLFVVLSSIVYYSMERSYAGNFSQPLDRTSALYFTVAVFSTVGFGDITARTDPARIAVTFQMAIDIILLGAGVKLFINIANVSRSRRSGSAQDG